ncbi:PstS family phosphate ABC transporter substrate-binding protein [Vitreimonas flagellata]|uniref:PstS family phosphate ABC transporter substrate-binding protein n=1 Tax=Vitreimonas flagellata TaxID=2560861 RepID=UPI0010752CC3|nr:PstS family phosphate ABC transporter substrate-binding protein [Vitreimonas flagellata]
MRKQFFLTAALAACAVALTACGSGEQVPASSGGSSSESIQVDGSSTVFPLSEAAAEAFTASQTGGARVTVGESGTGGGFRKFCRGETQVQGASRPILAEEMAACAAAGVTYVEVPIAFDGLTVVVHPSNSVRAVTIDELRRIWEPAAERTVTNWRQVNPRWPDMAMPLFGAGTASGTFDFFTEAVVGTAKASRTDYTPTEDDNVTVQGVLGNPGGMGYFGYAYYEQNRERLAALSINGVSPSPETIANGTYPLARPVFVYFNAEALRRPQVRRFAQYFVANAGRLAPEVGYVALPEAAYATFAERVTNATVGTAFGGHQEVGASIEEVITRPLVSAAPGAE